MPSTLETTPPARRHFTPRAFSTEWALQGACKLDAALPGFLSHLLHASDLKRQAIFAAIATLTLNEGKAEPASATTQRFARLLILAKPKQIVATIFGSVPNGLLGTLARLGPEPPMRIGLHFDLFNLFAEREHRNRANLLRRTSGEIPQRKIDIALLLDPLLLHQNVFEALIDTDEMSQLHDALELIRACVSSASDEALQQSVRELPAKADLSAWAARWLRKQDRSLLPPPIQDDPEFVPVYGAALEETGRRFRNCLRGRALHAAVGRHAYYEVVPSVAIVELTRLSSGGWVATEIGAPSNGDLRSETIALIQRKLEAHGIPSFSSATPSRKVRSIARLLNVWDLTIDQGDPATDVQDIIGLELSHAA